ncbi:FkbM family methyltransferase, partial [bacterium]|nr:FkbM family methyltransferase [bacterium]
MQSNYRSIAKPIFRTLYRFLPYKRPMIIFLSSIGISRLIPKGLKAYLVFSGSFTVQIEKVNFTMLHGYGREIEATIFWEGVHAFEPTTIFWWRELSKRSTYILDIGANTGIYSLIAKALNPKAEIHAFEPLARIHEILEENFRLNNLNGAHPPMKSYRIALSDYSGEGKMFDLPVEHMYTATLNRNLHEERGQSMVSVQEAVSVMRLDDFLLHQNIQGLDLIKIDVESHEPAVLRGIGEYLSKFHPTLIIEIWNNEVGVAVEAALAGCDYLYFALATAQ